MGKYWIVKTVGENATVETPAYYLEEGQTVTIKANDGYLLGQVKITGDNTTQVVTLKETENKKSYSFVLRDVFKGSSSTGYVTLTIPTTAVAPAQTVKLIQSVINITSSKTDTIALQSDVITLTPKTQTKFTGDVELILKGTSTQNVKIKPVDNKAVIKLSDYWNKDLTEITILAQADLYTIYTETTTNAYSNKAGNTEVTKDETLKVTATDEYYFDKGITIKYTVNGMPETSRYTPSISPQYYNEIGSVFTLPMSDVWQQNLEKVEVTANAVVIPPPEEVPYTEIIERVTSNIDTKPTEHPNEFTGRIKKTDTIIVTSDEGYSLQDAVEIYIQRERNQNQTHTYYPASASDAKYFNEDNTTFTIDIAEIWEQDTNRVILSAKAKQVYIPPDEEDPTSSSVTSFANVYSVDNGVLAKIASERFSKFSGQTNGEPSDIGNYIYQVYKYPLKFDPSLISKETSTIQMGYHTLSTTSNYFLQSRIKYDLGYIVVPEVYSNVYDYRDTQCLLHVPYAEPIEIESTYVIGQSLEIAYLLDLYNGTTTLEVYSDKIAGGLVTRVENVPVSYNIPFIQPQWNNVLNNVGGYTYNKVITPYIEIVRNIPYDHETIFGKEGYEYDKLKEFSGYIEVDDLDLSSSASMTEQQEIESLLSDGVIINIEQTTIPNTNK